MDLFPSPVEPPREWPDTRHRSDETGEFAPTPQSRVRNRALDTARQGALQAL